MGKTCDLCGRGSMKGATRSHSKIKTLKRQDINLQTKNIDGMKIKVCTSCLRTAAKTPKVKVAKTTPKPTPVVKKPRVAKVKAAK
jgi:ribosomal protein L28